MQLQPRCPFVKDECHEIDPDLEEKKPDHTAACILSVEEIEENKRRVDEELGSKRDREDERRP